MSHAAADVLVLNCYGGREHVDNPLHWLCVKGKGWIYDFPSGVREVMQSLGKF